MKFMKIIVDADICIKIGASSKYLFIERVFPCIAEKIFIHSVVYDEIMVPASAKQQIDRLIESGIAEIVNENSLSKVEAKFYRAIYDSLAEVMLDKNKPHDNRGEVCSLAFAKVMRIPIFATDEKDLQPIIDAKLNTGVDDISCLRIIDIINKIKSGTFTGLTRKEAKIIWVLAGKPKEQFDAEVWPL